MINASHHTSTPQPWWAKLTSLRAAAAPRIGLATLGMFSALACEPPSPSDIAFERWHDGNSEIYGMSADGSGQTRLTNNPVLDGSPSWSPDGGRIAFDSLRDENPEIYVMNADGSGQTRLTDDPEYDGSPSWSPQSVPGSRATPAP